MSKRIFFAALFLTLFTCAFSQEKARVEMLGKAKGSVKIFTEGGQIYLQARPLAKILKLQTSWFPRSGQLNIKGAGGYFAVLRDGQSFAVVNGKEEKLPAPAVLRGKDLYAPLAFFTPGSAGRAAGYDVAVDDGRVIISKPGAAAAGPPPALPAAQTPQPQPPAPQEREAEMLGDEFFFTAPAAAPVIKPQPQAVIKPAPPMVRIESKPGKKTRKARILIDAGHGGKDPGATRPSSAQEKDLNLDVAKMLYGQLKNDKDFEVKMTRGDDTFIALGARAKMANDFKADIFISIHTNAAKRVSADGFEVYFRSDKASSAEAAETAALENEALQYEGKSAAAVSFADLLLKSMAGNENMNESSKIAGHIRHAVAKNSKIIGIKTYENSCIKQANFYVLRGVEAPSVLVEMGYMSNYNDKKRLNNKAARAKLAESLREGIISYAKAEGWK